MVGRIVEIADDRRHLFVHRGFMVVKDTEGERKELGQVPLDDIAAVIANAHGLTYTNNLLVALAERGAPFVLCGANHNVVGMLLPLDGHHLQGKRIDAEKALREFESSLDYTADIVAKGFATSQHVNLGKAKGILTSENEMIVVHIPRHQLPPGTYRLEAALTFCRESQVIGKPTQMRTIFQVF